MTENDYRELAAKAMHEDATPSTGLELVNPHILTMFHVSEDMNICLDVEARPETHDMTIDNGDFTLTLSFDELEAWVGCLTRARDLLVYHKKGGA